MRTRDDRGYVDATEVLVTAGPEPQSVGGALVGLKPSGAAQQTDWVHSLACG